MNHYFTNKPFLALLTALFSFVFMGCGTTRMTDSNRAASEMLLVSQAVDEAVERMDFRPLEGKTVYVNADFIEKSLVDRGYLISSIRQQLLSHGALLREEPEQAIYVVELRTGGLGTDRHTLLFGSPQLSLPAIMPGQPTQVPELALVKKTEQKGIAKVGVFAYNRVTGRALWQSGLQEGESSLKDRWVFGAGPFSQGTIRKNTELAGEPLPKIAIPQIHLPSMLSGQEKQDKSNDKSEEHNTKKSPSDDTAYINQSRKWTNSDAKPPLQPAPAALLGLVGNAPAIGQELLR